MPSHAITADTAAMRRMLHTYSSREGAPPEAMAERDDSSSVDPRQADLDAGDEELSGLSIVDCLGKGQQPSRRP